MSLPQDKLDEIRAEAEKFCATKNYLSEGSAGISFKAGAILYAEKLEAVTKERDEFKQANSHLNEKIDAWKIIADDHAAGRLKRAEECDALKSHVKRLQEAYLPGNWEKLEAVTKERDDAEECLKTTEFLAKINYEKIQSQLAEERQYSENLTEMLEATTARLELLHKGSASFIIEEAKRALALKRPSEEEK